MSQQPLTYESVLQLIQKIAKQSRRNERKFERMMEASAKEADRRQEALAKQFAETDKRIADLGNRIGDIIEHMVGGGIVGKFQALGIEIKSLSQDKLFGIKGTKDSGQIDVFLENGDLVVLVEVKTKLTNDDVREHIEQLADYRLLGNDKRRILGAVAAAVAPSNVIKFAHRKGMYVIIQSGDAVEIVPTPKGFKAKEW